MKRKKTDRTWAALRIFGLMLALIAGLSLIGCAGESAQVRVKGQTDLAISGRIR